MDETFVVGVAAVATAILVFCGSVWFLLSLILGPRLAYFVTASVTLGFTLIMGVVWSINQLGPVGRLPEWTPQSIAEDQSAVEFGPAGQYPEQPWRVPNEDDEVENTKASDLESKSTDYLDAAIEDGKIDVVASADDVQVKEDSPRLLEQDGDEYGALVLEPVPLSEEDKEIGIPEPEPFEIFVVMKFDPGNPLGKARSITAGIAGLFVLHLIGLSRAEKRAKTALETA